MPSALHEGLVELFRNELSLSADLLSGVFRVPVPSYEAAQLGDPVIKDITPTERRSDAVTVFADAQDEPVLGVVVEVQLTWDDEKEWVWPAYLATLRARLRCPVVLLVVSPSATVAARCAVPIHLGHPGLVLTPLVLGPDQIPVITDPDQAAATPELAVLSAIAHGNAPEFEQILPALHSALEASEHGAEYADYVLADLPAAARLLMEAQMSTTTHRPYSDFFRRHYDQGQADGEAKGKAEGMAQAVFSVLATRGIDVPEDARERIADCTDLDQLDRWIQRAATAGTVDDLFA